MKKFKYNFNPIPTTKTQKVAFIVGIILFFAVPMILNKFNIDEELLTKLKFIVKCVIAVVSFSIIMLNNHQLIKQLKHDQKQLYLTSLDIDSKIPEFLKKEQSFSYATATEDEKINHVLYSLITAATGRSTGDFYVACADYSMDEIKEILSKFNFSKDLTKYLNDVVYNFITSDSVFIYGKEIENILNNRLFNTPLDEKLFDDKVLYNIYKNVRGWVDFDEKLNKYLIHYEVYNDKYGYTAWQQMVKYTYYNSEEQAWNKLNNIFSEGKKSDEEYFKCTEVDKEILYIMMLLKKFNGELIEPYKTIEDYISYINNHGHYNLFNNEPELANKIISISKEYISEEYYSNLCILSLAKENIDKCKQMDQYYFDNRSIVRKPLVDYAKEFNFRILQ